MSGAWTLLIGLQSTLTRSIIKVSEITGNLLILPLFNTTNLVATLVIAHGGKSRILHTNAGFFLFLGAFDYSFIKLYN